MADREGSDILGFRVDAERERMSDLERLLPFATDGFAAERRDGLSDRIRARVSWAANLLSSGDGWTELSAGVNDADLLTDEVVALATTRLMRQQGLDTGAFDAAEALIARLAALSGLKPLILGHTQEWESMNHTRGTVSLRYPGSRLWDLPFLAHEFGHHAIVHLPNLESVLDERPLERVVSRAANLRDTDVETANLASSRANELVADAFATVTCGPCYPIACLALRVPVGRGAVVARGGHPAWSERVAVMRSTLDFLSAETRLPRYVQQRLDVVDPLVRSVLGRMPDETLAAEEVAGSTVRAILTHRSSLVFRSGDEGIAVHAALRCRQRTVPVDADVRAVLDGAWRWRLNRCDSRADHDVGRLATEYCRSLGQGGA